MLHRLFYSYELLNVFVCIDGFINCVNCLMVYYDFIRIIILQYYTASIAESRPRPKFNQVFPVFYRKKTDTTH